jgi:vancomycin aglycone glucosyltransferase
MDATDGCDAIVATGLFPAKAAAQSVAESRGLQFFSVHFCPRYLPFCPRYLPSPQLPPVEFPGWPHPAGVTDNRSLWEFNIQVMNALFGEAVNSHRDRIGLPRTKNVRDHVFGYRPLLASDPLLGPWQPNALCQAVQTGAWLLPDSRQLPTDLKAFLDAGPPPVYVGFGSMAMQAAPNAARVAIEAVRAQGRRVLLGQGRAGLGAIDQGSDCFVIGEVNQQELFPKVAAIVHHGGAGTTTAAARAGTPQVIVPQVADQPYWAGQVESLRIGAAHDGPAPTFASLAAGLETALAVEAVHRASAVAGGVLTSGAATAAGNAHCRNPRRTTLARLPTCALQQGQLSEVHRL